MRFVSDFAAKRTRDAEGDWELFDVTNGPGYATFELRHPSRPAVRFWGQWEKIENIGGRTSLGHMRCRQVFCLKAVDARVGSLATAEERSLIEQSLAAYGGLHNGSLGPLEVIYEN